MQSNASWFGRRWIEFTKGYSAYLIFALNFSIFITTLYGWVIKDMFTEVPILAFATLMVAIIVPIGIFIGHFHFGKTYPIESDIAVKNNPYTFKIYPQSKETVMTKALWMQSVVLFRLISEDKNIDDGFKVEYRKMLQEVEYLLDGKRSDKIL